MIFVPGQGHCLPIINTGNPINWRHPINQGLLSRWKVLPNWTGGLGLVDLVRERANNGAFVNLAPGSDWYPGEMPGQYGNFRLTTSNQVRVGLNNPSWQANLTEGWTYNFWCKRATTGSLQVVWNYYQSQFVGNNFQGYFTGGDAFLINIPWGPNVLTSTGTITDTTDWHMVTVTKNASTDTWSIYFDGVFDSSAVNATAQKVATHQLYFGVQQNNGSYDSWANLYADDLGIWDRDLSAREVYDFFIYSKSRFDPTLAWVSAHSAPVAPTGGPFPHHIRRSNALLGGFAA